MYLCQKCQTRTELHVPATKVVTQTRPKSYNVRWLIFKKKKTAKPELFIVPLGDFFEPPPKKVQDQRREWFWCIDRGGDGHETVRELTVCPKCAQ